MPVNFLTPAQGRRYGRYNVRPGYRRHILTQLNRHESRNGLARHVFDGQKGELRQRYPEGQEDQLGALVVNALILWTTRYMNAALNTDQRLCYGSRR